MAKQEEFKILSARQHVRMRPGMWVGSTAVTEVERFVKGKWKQVRYVPALNKMIDEIIDNSLDEAIRTQFKFAKLIAVDIRGDEVSVTDNGRGIPQDMVLDAESGKKILQPVAAWTKVNSGTSFTEERTTVGANGVGSACVNFMSTKFVGETWRDGKKVTVDCSDGANKIDVGTSTKVGPSGTKVTFSPDFTLFEVDSMTDVPDTFELIEDRLLSLSLAFPEIKFVLNGRHIKVKDIKAYADMFEADTIVCAKPNVSFFVGPSPDGFHSNSFVNGVNTRQGGTYIDYIIGNIMEQLSQAIKKKHKIEVTKAAIKEGMTLVLFVRNFKDPRFDSQTKERLTSPHGQVVKHYEESGGVPIAWVVKQVMNTPGIIDPIIETQLAKKMALEKRMATLEQKKLKKVKVAKHIPATSYDATLFLTEGDSAIAGMVASRDPAKVGGFPLRGVVPNTWNMSKVDVLKNKELSEIIAILGLNINDPDSVDSMYYKYVSTLTDADHDGAHIATLLLAFFYKFWPRLFEEGRVSVTRSPIMIATDGKKSEWFYDYDSGEQFKLKNPKWKIRHIKGLASLEPEEYSKMLNSPKQDAVKVDDPHMFEMMFGVNSDLRKQYMMED